MKSQFEYPDGRWQTSEENPLDNSHYIVTAETSLVTAELDVNDRVFVYPWYLDDDANSVQPNARCEVDSTKVGWKVG